ncbi:MAG TPA: hypothetical protein VK647_15055 [Gemmatimonadales bacterium]|nr:hypothetical protein [Gemmatimonadales bacterium]
MSPSGLIQALRTPRSGPGTTGGRRGTTLPPDLLREAGRRLGILARLIIALAVINLTLGHTLFPALLVAWPWVSDVVVSSVALLSLGVFLYTRRPNTDPASFVTLGLVYEVVVAAAVAATAADKIIGTPAFMPPEMAAGDAVDGRADLYGVGCVAYWLLTGRLVFDGETAYQVVAQHLNAAPEPPSHRSPHPISATLDEVILSCLEKDPARRPQDALELARRLAECDVEAPWTEEQAGQWWQARLPRGEAPSLSRDRR